MRIFITGASGYVGAAVAKELIASGDRVVALARSEANAEALRSMRADVLRGSLEDLDSLRKGAREADGVVHCAFIHDTSRSSEAAATDRRAIEAMGEAMEDTNKPLIVTSGVGLIAPGRLVTEDDPVPNYERVSEPTAFSFVTRGVRAMAMRMPQVHGGDGKAGGISFFYDIAREKKRAAYIGDGGNGVPAAHRADVARLYRLALEKGVAGKAYHAVAEECITAREIASVFGRHLNAPVVSITPEEAPAHFGPMAHVAGLHLPASGALTQKWLGWEPREIGLIEDISQPGYFSVGAQ
jgi:nucleoside-diphosphate-sugar epimerase